MFGRATWLRMREMNSRTRLSRRRSHACTGSQGGRAESCATDREAMKTHMDALIHHFLIVSRRI